MRTLLALVLFSAAAIAAPPPLLFAPAQPKPGDAVLVTSTVAVTFDVRGASEVTKHAGKSLVFTMPASGTVVIVATAGAQAKPADVAVVVFGFAPGPNPTPPTPPPGPSADVKALAADLVKAFSLESAEDKKLLPALQKVWRDGIAGADTAKTWGELEAGLKDASTKAGIPNHLTFTRMRIANEMLKRVPGLSENASDVVLDADGRALAKTTITLIADALGLVK